jgi:hypothetical protein
LSAADWLDKVTMMTLRSMILSMAAASIAIAPVSAAVAAPANPAAKLSVSQSVRTSTTLRDSSREVPVPLLIVIAVGVIVGGILILDGSDSESP